MLLNRMPSEDMKRADCLVLHITASRKKKKIKINIQNPLKDTLKLLPLDSKVLIIMGC